jgi:hypothetical protein
MKRPGGPDVLSLVRMRCSLYSGGDAIAMAVALMPLPDCKYLMPPPGGGEGEERQGKGMGRGKRKRGKGRAQRPTVQASLTGSGGGAGAEVEEAEEAGWLSWLDEVPLDALSAEAAYGRVPLS